MLLLSAGAIIHMKYDEQDIRRVNKICVEYMITYSAFSIGSLAIMGFPFLTGFYSKDLILDLYILVILLVVISFTPQVL